MQLETLLAKLMVEFTKNKSFMHEAVAVSLQANSFKASAKTMKALVSSSAELIQTLVDVFTVSDTEISADFKV
ncbi:hypothetical protein HID58_078062 [Brassica napus]|uniref:Uncharacterized protein n=1 Tax=Brassica napus TaxID=3708 RepID=A0ABQ7YS45_BRANA|nr:hypothetical protein HID58_078062 [Brassica napus]